MPRLVHEQWCETHYEGEDVCATKMADFGPLVVSGPDGELMTVGGISAEKRGHEAIRVFFEYRTRGGLMDTWALRAVREAVTESPTEFLAALDKLIEALGADVPAAREVRQAEAS